MNNPFYNKIASFSKKAFYDPDSRIFVAVNDFLSFVTIISIVTIILETVPALSPEHPLFLFMEYTAVVFFSVEYVCRIIGANKKLSYVFSFFGLIDLLAIIPTLLHLSNLTPLKSVRAIRILRFLRILRITKVNRIEIGDSQEEFVEVYKINLKIYFLASLTIILILGSLAYIFEEGNNGFGSIPESMLWVTKIVLADPGIKTFPQTVGGTAISLVARFFGLVLLGFLIRIVGDLINRFLLGIKTIDRDTLDNKF
jgi:voltage-gated potassium channel